jgi:hypothetical protein
VGRAGPGRAWSCPDRGLCRSATPSLPGVDRYLAAAATACADQLAGTPVAERIPWI